MSANNFMRDNKYSKKMDVVLSEYWKNLAYDGRYIFTNSEMLQKTLGIDIIIQIQNNDREITIDTKHVRGNYKKLFIEGMSCTVEQYGLKEGWGIKENGRPDYIMHIMHGHCRGCSNNCDLCEYGVEHISSAYITKAENILNWYRPKYINGYLPKTKEAGYHKELKANMTDGHNISLSVMMREMGTIVCKVS